MTLVKLQAICAIVWLTGCSIFLEDDSGPSTDGGTPVWLEGFGARLPVTLNAMPAAELTTPVVPILVNSDELSTALSTGADFAFTLAGETTILSAEIEQFDQSTGELVAWVKIPRIGANETVDLHLYFENESAQISSDAANLWSDYAAVFHLEDRSDSGPTAYDTTVTGNAVAVDGIIGGAQLFDGAGRIEIESSGLDFGSSSFAITAWVNKNVNTPYARVVDRGITNVVAEAGYAIIFGELEQAAYLSDPNPPHRVTGFDEDVIGEWVFLAMVLDRQTDGFRSYQNGAPSMSLSLGTLGSVATSVETWIGSGRVADTGFSGLIDAVRFHNRALPPELIALEYRAVTDNGFVVLGELERPAN